MAKQDGAGTAPESGKGRDSAAFMKGVVIFLGILLVLGFVVIFSTIIYRSVKLAEGKDVSTTKRGFAPLEVSVAADSAVTGIDVDGNRMAVHTRGAEGEEILVIDIRRGELLGRVKLNRE